jgi:hypothetical protein
MVFFYISGLSTFGCIHVLGLFTKDVYLEGGVQKLCSLYGRREDERRQTMKDGLAGEVGSGVFIQMLQDALCEQPPSVLYTFIF